MLETIMMSGGSNVMFNFVESLDLVDDENSCFRATINIHTPKPHFIIVLKDTVKSDYNHLNAREKLSLIWAAETLQTKYPGFQNAVLSIHCGSWASNRNEFHGHLCVDAEPFQRVIVSNTNLKDAMIESLSKGQTMESSYPEEYFSKVQSYPQKSYHEQDVRKIEERGPVPKRHRLRESHRWKAGSFPLKYVFHESLPRLGFKLAKTNGSTEYNSRFRNKVLQSLFSFVKEKVLFEEEDACHVCLLIGKDAWECAFPDSELVLAYIEMTAVRFSQLCPRKLEQNWIEEFKQETGYACST